MKKTALTLSLLFLTFSLTLAQEKTENIQEIKTSMNELLKEVEQDMLTLLEAQEQHTPAFYYLDKTRNRLRHKLDGLSLLEKPDLLTQILELDREKRRLLQASSPTNPVIRNLDAQIAALIEQMK